jgi:hypothetical protein
MKRILPNVGGQASMKKEKPSNPRGEDKGESSERIAQKG